MPAYRYMPVTLGMIHGIAVPIANSSEAMMTGTLRVCILSEIGPEISEAVRETVRETTMVMMDMVAMVPAASVLVWCT